LKTLLRNPGVQAFLGWLLWLHLVVTLKSRRWVHDNLACVEPVLETGKPAVALFWHGSIPLCLGLAPVWWRREKVRCMVSPSADGEFIAQALSRAGFPAIRTSSAKKGDSSKARAAVAAIREAMNWINEGGVLIVTPDGPRGPAEVIAAGSMQIARKTGAPIYLMGLAVSPAITLDTWDRITFAWPFGRGATAWDGPYYVPTDADDAALGALTEELSAKLTATRARAEALVARR
jgi:lysophospholipid acyltransferase (LPLAT)-like uncharacterized protein